MANQPNTNLESFSLDSKTREQLTQSFSLRDLTPWINLGDYYFPRKESGEGEFNRANYLAAFNWGIEVLEQYAVDDASVRVDKKTRTTAMDGFNICLIETKNIPANGLTESDVKAMLSKLESTAQLNSQYSKLVRSLRDKYPHYTA